MSNADFYTCLSAVMVGVAECDRHGMALAIGENGEFQQLCRELTAQSLINDTILWQKL
ncbi:hypothetical protein [Floridanema aerugineum]|uniref:Uncharacterized protein n=1 Tax=Floridaenema aerugineum BLCC-F46 TaxID=3153654 RepID=A0ABV4X658_9CYAN